MTQAPPRATGHPAPRGVNELARDISEGLAVEATGWRCGLVVLAGGRLWVEYGTVTGRELPPADHHGLACKAKRNNGVAVPVIAADNGGTRWGCCAFVTTEARMRRWEQRQEGGADGVG